jgi:hypothetical protein
MRFSHVNKVHFLTRIHFCFQFFYRNIFHCSISSFDFLLLTFEFFACSLQPEACGL